MKRYGGMPRLSDLRERLNNLTVTGRIGLGFAIATALVLVLALVGVGALLGVTRDVRVFSTTSDASQMAADVDIGLRNLEVAVRDHLGEGDPDSLEQAEQRRAAVQARLDDLAGAVTDPNDGAAVTEAMAALEAYWTGFERLLEIRAERSRLTGDTVESLVVRLRERLDLLKASGGVDSATLAGDAAIAVTLLQDDLVRFVERRDAVAGERMRRRLTEARERMVEMNRYLWVPGTRQTIAEVERMLDEVGKALDDVESQLVAEDAVRTDELVPNAAVVTDRAAEIRQRADRLASALRRGLADDASVYVRASLWVGGAVLAIGLLMTWLVARSVARPVRAMAGAVGALAQGNAEVRVPVVVRNDEIGDLARAVETLRGNTAAAERERRVVAADMERLRAEAQEMHVRLLDEKERAEAANLAKTEFLVKMGQELHGPVSGIVHHSQTLMSELHRLGAGELANDVEMIQWSGEQLAGLIDSILDYAKVEAGAMEVCLQDFDVGRLIAEARERATPTADLNGNTLLVMGAPGLGAMQSDFGKVRQILLNLLDNACKFTHGGQVTLAAERTEREARPWLRFTVTDTGIGFPPAQAGRLFQPFARGTNAGDNRQRGAGLGLTLVAHYCAMLGGHIEVASTPGQGTRVSVSIPAVHQQEDGNEPLRIDSVGAVAERPLLTVMNVETAPAR